MIKCKAPDGYQLHPFANGNRCSEIHDDDKVQCIGGCRLQKRKATAAAAAAIPTSEGTKRSRAERTTQNSSIDTTRNDHQTRHEGL